LMKSPNRRFLAVAELAETAINRPEHMFPACDTDPERSHRSLRRHGIAQIVIASLHSLTISMCLSIFRRSHVASFRSRPKVGVVGQPTYS
jgi:hypothetical protein